MFKDKNTKVYEFLALFTMCIGTVIGSGIFVKNNTLLIETGNPIIAIILWVVVGISCVLTVYVFIEIASTTRDKGNGTIGNWTKILINRKTASFFSILYLIVYVPGAQSVFSAGFVTYLFIAIGQPLSADIQLTIMMLVGISVLIICAIVNGFKPMWSDKFHHGATFFKFIPLIACLIAGFIMTSSASAIGNEGSFPGTTQSEMWSTSNFGVDLFIRGFGPILFAFDGYIFIANRQKHIKHKEVVAKALVAGMIFIAIFYVLMAVSLFLGSPDGSIVKLLEKIFSGGAEYPALGAKNAARIFSNICLMIICFQGVNIFSMIGTRGLESDAQAKLIYTKSRQMNFVKAALVQLFVSLIIFVALILLANYTVESQILKTSVNSTTYEIWRPEYINNYLSPKGIDISKWVEGDFVKAYIEDVNGSMAFYAGMMSSTAAAFGFLMVSVTLIAGLVNRYLKRVETVKVKGFLVIGIPASFLMGLFFLLAIAGFLIPTNVLNGSASWINSSGMWFFIYLVAGLGSSFGYWLYQEYRFKKDPFKTGFEGEIESTDLVENKRNIFFQKNK